MATTTYASGALVSRPSLVEAFFGWLNRFSVPSENGSVDYTSAYFSLRGL
ncbi:hypothetical protein [Terrihabitans sp. B22-R8]